MAERWLLIGVAILSCGGGRPTVHAEIVVTGSELLLGETVDTNSCMMARLLRDIGLDLFYKTTVGDNRQRLAAVVSLALERSDIVLVSGGLGPTVDDVTREAVSDATGRPLVFHPELLDQIAERFARFGRPMTDNNRRQAMVPRGGTVIENPVGTAPAFIVEETRGTVICLPGVPRELEYLMERRVVPYLKARVGPAAVIFPKVLRTCAIGESQIDARIGDLMSGSNPTIGLAAHSGQVDVRITAKAHDQAEADRLIAPMEAEVRARLGDVIYGEGTETLEGVVGRLLTEGGKTLALADSVTGGMVAEMLVDTPEARVLISDERYQDALSAAATLHLDAERLTAQPRPAVEDVAERVRANAGASLGLAVLGMLPPPGSATDQPSRAYLSLSDGKQVASRSYQFGDENAMTRRWLSIRALDLVRRHLIGAEMNAE